jgi:hypothetical protein
MVLGMRMRAVAIMRPMSKMEGALFSSSGVPSTATAPASVCPTEARISKSFQPADGVISPHLT